MPLRRVQNDLQHVQMLLVTSFLLFFVVQPAMAAVCEDRCQIVFLECQMRCEGSAWAWLGIKEVLCKRRCNTQKEACLSMCMIGNVA